MQAHNKQHEFEFKTWIQKTISLHASFNLLINYFYESWIQEFEKQYQ